ncbi:S-layer homology domain-containing protein [Thiolapillus brandeum]|uniref:SLH domain-containing protein n=1 Tax=Thiolapillus brandeum TaxID=1076588 RepID=A0A7U6GGK2_9GAMM|nr:S-layer homology domain-containing protein [Thiolapillus brandeum]BAO43216.1 hypothetical protein TBH_C0270 [Thiolapillus brandeum]
MKVRANQLFGLALAVAVSGAWAAVRPPVNLGIGAPATLEALPAGQFKTAISTLEQDAQMRALQWLQKISITDSDMDYLRVDPKGGIFFADTFLPSYEGLQARQKEEPLVLPAISASQTFFLHSRPGATNVVYLDFDGHTITGTSWNSYVGTDPLIARPYDIDGNPGSFSTQELSNIGEIWHRIAEDLAPFNIDVTTEEPAAFNATTGRVLVTEDVDVNGAAMPAQGAGGVAYVDVFGIGSYSSYSPALVYFNNLGGGQPTYVAEASSHEFGHNLGLSHDGTNADGDGSYYTGHGSGYVSWAPIMGASYYTNVTQWSKGEYSDANQFQDDLAIIGAKLGYVADDHGDTMGTATSLVMDASGNVSVSNPETDPDNSQPANKGIIGTRSDVDVFSLDVADGAVSLTVTPAWDAFTRSSLRGANLDVEALLLDANGALVASAEPVDDTFASISANVSAGRYYLQIDGVGNSVGQGYSDYASLGEYFVSGSVAVSQTTFSDVPASYWAYDDIEILNDRSITTGCGMGLYCPEGLITRAEMAVFLERAVNGGGFVPDSASGSLFSDVPVDYWAAAWIEKLASDGITGGCDADNYCPDSQITRGQMAVFLLRAKYGASYVPPAASGTMFSDVPGSYWAAAWVEALANEGVTSGCGGGNFCPDAEVSRAQMAVFLVNTFGW